MASAVGLLASAVVGEVGAKLGSITGDQITMLCGFKDDLEDMRHNLDSMRAVLEEAERRSVREGPVRLWLKRLKKAAYDISDMLDEFKETEALSCLVVAPRISMANKMKKMKDELRKINEGYKDFNFTPNSNPNNVHQLPDPRETTSIMNKSAIVGRDKDTENVIALLSGSNHTQDSAILPIFGLGGIGKTTLAQLIFSDGHFKDYDHRVWVYVSQVFDLKRIGNSIISQVLKEGNQSEDNMEMINNRLRHLLQNKKTLIILDDLWERDDFQLDKLKVMLNISNKIKVLVTTRNEGIAKKVFRCRQPYKLNPLDSAMCWNIIQRVSNIESRAGKELYESVGRDIANKCGGVALAAQALGFLLSGKSTLAEWITLSNSDTWTAFSDSTVLPSLMLSYKSMPPHLRLCFAYCAIFPKGHNMRKDELVHQWIALDFTEPSNELSGKQLGEKYVKQLLGMSFIQRSSLPMTSWEESVFSMHDLVHDVARSAMEELVVFDAPELSHTREQKYCRYALLANYSKTQEISTILPARLRALHFLDCGKLELRDNAFSFAKFLRVLDLTECSMKELPSSIRRLSQLRFLVAPNLQGRMFPMVITQLSKLQYLDFHGSQIAELPISIGQVKCLMHLDLSGSPHLADIPENLCNLTKLQYLNLSNCSNLKMLPEAVGKLTELQYLNLSGCSCITSLPVSFRELKNLVHLDMSSCSNAKGKPENLGGLSQLQYLNLSSTSERWTDHANLEFISSLIHLEYLDLSKNKEIKSVPESLGNLKNLHTLDLSDCPYLYSLPQSIGTMSSLEFLLVKKCSENLKEFMKQSRFRNNLISLPHFVVHSKIGDSSSNLHQLEIINPDELEISCLENVRSVGEARRVQLSQKKNLSKLTMNWSLDVERLLKDKDVLQELMPPEDLKDLNLHGYHSINGFPTWLMNISTYLPNLVIIQLRSLQNCRDLPPLGQLPNLKALYLMKIYSITKINSDLCGGKGAFQQLSVFSLFTMEKLEEWNTTYCDEDGVEVLMFPMLKELIIMECPRLTLKPRPPTFHTWLLKTSDLVISSWDEGNQDSHYSSSSSHGRLVIQQSKVPVGEWRLLHHLRALQELRLNECDNLTGLPDSVQRLASLRSLGLTKCEGISALPEWLSDLPSLESLQIHGCKSIKRLPRDFVFHFRGVMHVLDNTELEQVIKSDLQERQRREREFKQAMCCNIFVLLCLSSGNGSTSRWDD